MDGAASRPTSSRNSPFRALTCASLPGSPGATRLWPADLRSDLGGQCRPDAGDQTLRAGQGLPVATYATWWIKAASRKYILRSWSLVKMGTTANQKKLVLQPAQGQEQDNCARRWRHATGPGEDHRPRIGVTETDVMT